MLVRPRPHDLDVAASLEEGIHGLFTINRFELSQALHRCLGTMNIIDSSHSGMSIRTRRVGRWMSADMALRWAAVSFLNTEKNFRRILSYTNLRMLQARLNDLVAGDDVNRHRRFQLSLETISPSPVVYHTNHLGNP